jgi:hypothetical protein
LKDYSLFLFYFIIETDAVKWGMMILKEVMNESFRSGKTAYYWDLKRLRISYFLYFPAGGFVF